MLQARLEPNRAYLSLGVMLSSRRAFADWARIKFYVHCLSLQSGEIAGQAYAV